MPAVLLLACSSSTGSLHLAMAPPSTPSPPPHPGLPPFTSCPQAGCARGGGARRGAADGPGHVHLAPVGPRPARPAGCGLRSHRRQAGGGAAGHGCRASSCCGWVCGGSISSWSPVPPVLLLTRTAAHWLALPTTGGRPRTQRRRAARPAARRRCGGCQWAAARCGGPDGVEHPPSAGAGEMRCRDG